RESQPVLPYRNLTAGWRLADGSLWVGCKGGLLFLDSSHTAWRVFHSRRWLPDNHVMDLSVTKDGICVKTSAGMCRLFQQKKCLEQKMAEIHAVLRRCHLREGLVGDIELKKPGSLEGGW